MPCSLAVPCRRCTTSPSRSSGRCPGIRLHQPEGGPALPRLPGCSRPLDRYHPSLYTGPRSMHKPLGVAVHRRGNRKYCCQAKALCVPDLCDSPTGVFKSPCRDAPISCSGILRISAAGLGGRFTVVSQGAIIMSPS